MMSRYCRTIVSKPGYLCTPCIITVTSSYGMQFTCDAFSVKHDSYPQDIALSQVDAGKGVIISSSVDTKQPHKRKYTYVCAILDTESQSCDHQLGVLCMYKLSYTPPQRGWHGSSQADLEPYIVYDTGNIASTLMVEATFGTASDSKSIDFAACSNPNPSSHLSHPTDEGAVNITVDAMAMEVRIE